MLPFFDVRQHAHGVIAIGQFATGFIAIGQVAVGVVAFGQVAQGVVAVGQASIGVVTIGMITVGVGRAIGMMAFSTGYALGMLAVGWRARGLAALSLRFAPVSPAPELTSLAALQSGEVSEGWLRAQARAQGDDVSWTSEGQLLALTWDPSADGEPDRLRGDVLIRVASVEGRLLGIGGQPAPPTPGRGATLWVARALLAAGTLTAFSYAVLFPLFEGLG